VKSRFEMTDRQQVIVFAVACIALIAAGFFWALFGDAASVIPVPPATPQATPTLP
jgi:hypothetical protein